MVFFTLMETLTKTVVLTCDCQERMVPCVLQLPRPHGMSDELSSPGKSAKMSPDIACYLLSYRTDPDGDGLGEEEVDYTLGSLSEKREGTEEAL